MPRGQPDYGLYTQTPVASGISDPGEAAARLGGINVYDRRGWTVWMDDFEAPVLRWGVASTAGSPDPLFSQARQWMGVQSVHFATAIGALEYSYMARRFPLLRLGRIGIEFFIRLETHNNGYMTMGLDIYDGTNITEADIILDSAARTASILTPAGKILIASNCFRIPPNKVWLPVKLVVDMDTDMHVRLLVGPTEYDISAHALRPSGATTEEFVFVSFQLLGDGTETQNAYLDTFILTQNEP